MRLDNIRRIITDDYKKEDRDSVGKLGLILNGFMQQIYDGLQKNINFDNLNREALVLTIQVDSTGKPKITTKFSSKLSKVIGITVINCVNNVKSTVYPVSWPGVSFTQINKTVYEIKNISGLLANNDYNLTLELIGE
jgi:hypothetical protein